MTLPDWNDATRAQITAARPDISTWLSANAGSGKTRVLTDRVARLLLDGVAPQHILCLTYTKAAASEMQNRLFRRLGEWAMMEDDALRLALRDLGVLKDVPATLLREARTLFAQAIETPGGLKIQTIHSFCAALLRRFPLEAGVSPQFKEIEDRAAELLRAEIVDEMAEGADAALVADLALHYTGEDFVGLTQSITAQRELFAQADADLETLFELPPGFDLGALPCSVMNDAVARWMPDAIAVFKNQPNKTMHQLAEGLSQINFDTPDLTDLERLKGQLLTKDLTPRKRFPTKGAQTGLGQTLSAFEDLMQRTAEAHEMEMRARNLARTGALHRFAARFITRYEAEKLKRGWLDFDDLILRARALLNDPKVAAWVLYRIDGGIDHILVDEAQDTSPRQWDVIEKLADEFTSGAGAREPGERTLFVVGDKKQSIYSFQGADPREFDRKRDAFRDKLHAANLGFQNQSLDYSFRSSPAILGAVDQTFNTLPDPRMGEPMIHLAFKDALPGRVDHWPLVEPTTRADDDPDWTKPVDRKSPQHHTVILADQIAAQIRHLVEGEHYIPDEGPDGAIVRRRIRPGDFLILVRSRGELFSEIIRACKAADLQIAGADRLKVGAELAVRDIAALLSFLATPDDSLSLATALRSPLFGWDEQALFTLAHGRGHDEPQLWQALRSQTDRYPETLAILRDLRGQVDFLRPYDLIERVLTLHDGRRRLMARLGAEAEDGIDALLGQALAYEQTEVPSLTGFLEWMQSDDLEIKRQIDSASDQIRVMSVHGAKGLEAPIVILPDTGLKPDRVRDDIITLDGVPIWKPSMTATTAKILARLDEIKAAQAQELMRLLYVAMTRAEKWLIVAAAGKLPTEPNSWYQMVEAAMGHLNAVTFSEGHVTGKRYQVADWDGLPLHDAPRDLRKTAVLEPVFTQKAPDVPPRPEILSPSDLGGAKALPGDDGLDEDAAKAYGSLVHLLLEILAPLDPAARGAAAEQMVQQHDPETAARATAEALSVLDDAALAHVFAADALAETTVTADLGDKTLSGIIDRLIVSDDRVLAVDFKTNRTVPDTPDACPEGILRQMGAYAHALAAVYPGRRIDTAILWTHAQTLMILPPEAITSALRRTGHLDAAPARS